MTLNCCMYFQRFSSFSILLGSFLSPTGYFFSATERPLYEPHVRTGTLAKWHISIAFRLENAAVRDEESLIYSKRSV